MISRFEPMNFCLRTTLSPIGGEGQGEGAAHDLPKIIAACKLLDIKDSLLQFMERTGVRGRQALLQKDRLLLSFHRMATLFIKPL
jgi:hypothetical protein